MPAFVAAAGAGIAAAAAAIPAGVAAAGLTAAGTIGGALLSSSGGGGKGGGGPGSTATAQQQETSHTPWGPQGTAVEAGLNNAQDVYNTRTAQGPYTGDLTAGYGNATQQAIDQGTYAGNNFGSGQMMHAADVGTLGTGGMGAFSGNANQIASSGIGGPANQGLSGALSNIGSGTQPVVNSGLSSALHSAATNGAQSIGDYNAGISGVMNRASADPTQQLVGNAQSYMNNGATQGMLDNVNHQIDTTLNESTNPGLNRQAAMGGMLNSSRAGMAEAMANRDAALAKGNADSSIMNNAYNTGLGIASTQHTAGLNTALAAGTAGLTGNSNLALGAGNQDISSTNSQIGAATSGLGQQTSRDTADANARLQGNSQLLGGVNTGLQAGLTGINLAQGSAGLLSTAGGLQQQQAQANLTNQYQKYQMGNQYQQGVLNDFMGNATKPSGYYNTSSTTNETKTPPSMIPQLLAQGGAALGSQFLKGGILYDSLTGKPSAGPNTDYLGTGAYQTNSGYGVSGPGQSPYGGGSDGSS